MGNETYWNNIIHTIPATLPDGSYTLRITAIRQSGQITQKNFPVTVRTPINLVADMPPAMVTTDTVGIEAKTTRYANTVTVQLHRGTPYSTNITLSGTQSGNLKEWIRAYTVPANIPDGDYTARFTASTHNGNSEYVDVNYRVDSLKITGFLQPNPAMAGDQIIFIISTEGFAERLEIFVDPDIMSRDTRGAMGYSTQTYPISVNVDSSQMAKTDKIKYILWHTTDETLDKDNNRLRQPYKFVVRAYKGITTKEIELELEVKRNILELLKPGIKDKHDK